MSLITTTEDQIPHQDWIGAKQSWDLPNSCNVFKLLKKTAVGALHSQFYCLGGHEDGP